MVTGEDRSMLGRFVRILETFTPATPRLTVSELARRTGLPLATTSRLVIQLVDAGLLRRGDDGLVEMGLRLWELATRAQPSMGLREIAMPFIQILHAAVGQHTQLGILDGTSVMFLERLRSAGAAANITRVAGRLPLHLSSSGLVLLANAPPALLEQVLAGPLSAPTRASITEPEHLRRFVANVRREGYAYCPGFIHPASTGLAAPLRSGDRVVATISLVVPNDDRARHHLPALMECASQISRTLGRLNW